MHTTSRTLFLAAMLFCVTSIAVLARQGAVPAGPTSAAPQMSDQFFKDVRVLKGIPVDEFIDTMGMFAGATSKDCTGCHSPLILDGQPLVDKADRKSTRLNSSHYALSRMPSSA